jgi:hypothetical protein
VSVMNTRSLGRFWPVSWTITQFWGPEVISMVVEPHGALMCWLSRLAVWAGSGPFLGLLLSFGVLE